jgi:hypothetical protein
MPLWPFSALDLVPPRDHGSHRPGTGAAEDMGMAPDHFRLDPLQEPVKPAPALPLGHQRNNEHRVESIAQLLLQLAVPAAAHDFKHFPRFFNQVGQERGNSLSAVPSAAAWRL